MEWINPEYAHVVAALRQRQTDAPAQQCNGCEGRGERIFPQPYGAERVTCRRCNGSGSQTAGFRSFIMS